MIRKSGMEVASDGFEQHVYDNAMQITSELGAAPTTVGGELPKHGDSGFFGTDFYINFSGTVRRIPFTNV